MQTIDDLDNLTDEQWEQLAQIPDEQTTTTTEIQPIAEIGTPWAIDAGGNLVPTHYELNGDTLTQIITPTNTITADPSWSFAWKAMKCLGQIGLLAGPRKGRRVSAVTWRNVMV